jgi:hypothetical protein
MRDEPNYHCTGLPISSGHTSVRGNSASSRVSSDGDPVRPSQVISIKI